MVLAYIEEGSLAGGGGRGGGEGRSVLIDVMLLQESFTYKNNLHFQGNNFSTRQTWGVISLIKTLVKKAST